jgi:hypothetical protein
MQQVVTFTKEYLPYKCVLNQRGRRRYGTIDDLLDNCSGTLSTVGTSSGNVILETQRNSTRYSTYLEFFDSDIAEYEALLKGLVPQEKRKYVKWFPRTQQVDLIKYEAGGFFNTHYDERLDVHHYATLLIFPPATGRFAHSGGRLTITQSDGQTFIFDSDRNEKWTFIAFQTGVPHECELVVWGTRVVFKTELYYSSKRAGSPLVTRREFSPIMLDRVRQFN